MAQTGGIGVIHRNLGLLEQAAEVSRVKRFESGVVDNPITLRPDQTLADAKALQDRYNVTGFPVVDETGDVYKRQVRYKAACRPRRSGAGAGSR